jgi:hypothetical protein
MDETFRGFLDRFARLRTRIRAVTDLLQRCPQAGVATEDPAGA